MFLFFSVLSIISDNEISKNIPRKPELKSGDYCIIRHFDNFSKVFVTKVVKNIYNQYEAETAEIERKISSASKNTFLFYGCHIGASTP